jgi:GAF domain-containing protein
MSDPTLHSTLGSLSRALLTEDANLQAGLRRIALAGCTLLTKCAGASVTLVEKGLPTTVAATNDTALTLDESQYEVDDGPCLTAARQNQTVRIDDAATDRRWPNFVAAAGDVGVWSSLSLPLQIADESYCGGLNLYGLAPMAFSHDDEVLAQAFADQASVIVANTRAYWAAFEMTKNLTIAMESREVIDQAKGILMGQHRVDADAAFAMLRDRSQAENRKLRDIAAEIVDHAIRGDA